MKSNKLVFLLLFLISFFFHSIAEAQDLGVLPVIQMKSDNILFIDGQNGELSSFSAMPEQPYFIAVNEEEGVFYAQTRHFLVKGDLASGDILDQFQFMEFLEQQADEMMDPNLMIYPLGVTSKGKALFYHNERLRELQLEQLELVNQMQNAGSDLKKINELSKKSLSLNEELLPLTSVQDLRVASIPEKTVVDYGKYDMKKARVFSMDNAGIIHIFDKYNMSLLEVDVTTKEEVSSNSFEVIYQVAPEAYKLIESTIPVPVADNIVALNIATGISQGLFILYDTKNTEVLIGKEYEKHGEGNYPLTYVNCETYYFGGLTCKTGPMPTLSMPEMAGTSKKALAEYQQKIKEAQSAFQKELKDWQDSATSPENCSLQIYKDKEMGELHLDVPNASHGTIYNDKYLVVQRNFEVSMYDLDTKELVWSVDTNF